MSPVARWSAIGAVALGIVTAASWDLGDPSPAAVARPDGAQLFQAKGCAACHAGPDGAPPRAAGFPSLAGAAEWAGARRPGLTAERYLAESIAAPGAFASPEFRAGQAGPTTAMPELRLTSEEIDALVEYLLRP